MKTKLLSKKQSINELEKRIRELENNLASANETIFGLQNDINKIISTKGWKFLEKLRNTAKKVKYIKTVSSKYLSSLRSLKSFIKQKMMKEDVRFCIGIPAYNHSEYIEQCINSCLNQTYKNFHIVIVDDNSTDKKTIEIIKKIKTKHTNKITCIFHQKNTGISNSINEQILATKFDYFAMLDCDDYLETNALKEVFFKIKEDNYPDYLFTDRNHVDMKGELLFSVSYGGFHDLKEKGLKLNEILPIGMATSHLKVVSNELIKKTGLFSNYFSIAGRAGCQDYDFALRSLLVDAKFSYVEKFLYNHRWHSKSVTLSNNSQQTQLSDQVQARYQISRYLNGINKIRKTDNKKIHVLFIVPYFVTGGAEIWLLNLISCLKDNGYIISIFTDRGDGNLKKAINDHADHISVNIVKESNENQFYKKIIDYVIDKKVDILHISNSEYGYKLLPHIQSIYPKPKVVDTVHSDVSGFIGFSLRYAHYLDHRVTVNNLAKNKLLSLNISQSSKITPIYNATNPVTNNATSKENIVLWVGRLSLEKNPLSFVKIAEKFSNEHLENYKFLMIGDGPERKTIEQYINKKKIKNITLLGEQSNFHHYYQKAKAILITSQTEGLPLVLPEAMSYKCIPLSTPVGGIPEVINSNQNGFLCKNIDEFVNNLKTLLKDEKIRQKIADASYKTFIEKLSTDIFCKNYTSLYNKLLEDPTITNPKQKITSICILTLNRYKALDNLLKSIKKYTKLPHEILILDQDSDEETKSYLKKLTDKNIKVFYSKKNLGCSGGRKYLIERTLGDYIVQLDNDLEVKEGWLEKMISAIEWNNEIGGACGRVTFPDGKTEYNGASYAIDGKYITYTLDGNGKDINDLSLQVENYSSWLPGGATIFKKDVFKDETYDEAFLNGFEDNDLSFRLEKHGWKFVNCPSCVFIHNHRMFLSEEDLKRDEKYVKLRNDYSRIKSSFDTFYKKHNLIINNPELWKLMCLPVDRDKLEKALELNSPAHNLT